jgi:hypothetical protein
MYMSTKPAAITRDLIKSAFYEKNSKAIARLNKILKEPFDDASDGFDGIIVFSDEAQLRYYSLTMGKKKIKILNIGINDVEAGMCLVIPDIVRKP